MEETAPPPSLPRPRRRAHGLRSHLGGCDGIRGFGRGVWYLLNQVDTGEGRRSFLDVTGAHDRRTRRAGLFEEPDDVAPTVTEIAHAIAVRRTTTGSMVCCHGSTSRPRAGLRFRNSAPRSMRFVRPTSRASTASRSSPTRTTTSPRHATRCW